MSKFFDLHYLNPKVYTFFQYYLVPSLQNYQFDTYQSITADQSYYIQPYSYKHHLSTQEIIQRFINSNISTKLVGNDKKMLHQSIADYFIKQNHITAGNPNVSDLETDIIVSQKIMYHLKEFFYLTTKRKRTQKISIRLVRNTRKKYIN